MSTEPHAYNPPSSAHIWRVCTGQPKQIRLVREPLPQDDTASREGTAAHWGYAEQMHDRMVGCGETAPNGVLLTDEMVQSADVMVEECQRIMRTATTRPVVGRTYGIEQRMRGLSEHRWGTPDFWFYDVNGAVLYVRDLKHGFGVIDVFECWQLLDYAQQLAHELQLPAGTRIDMGIVQPRAPHRDGPVRNWVATVDALRAYWFQLDMAAEESQGDGATLRPNAGCEHCDARHECPALQRDGYATAGYSEGPAALVLTGPALGLELVHLTEAATRLAARITGLQALADSRVRGGDRVPGWALERGESRAQWLASMTPQQVIAFGRIAGVDLQKPDAVLTPTQARKALGKAAHPIIDGLSERPPAALKLVRDDGADARRVFGS